MPVTQVGAIFGTRSKLLQRVYIPHADDSEIHQQHVYPTETLIEVPIEIYRDGGAIAVQGLIGQPTTNGHCAVVHRDTGEIIDRIVWDTTIHGNRHPDGHLIIEAA